MKQLQVEDTSSPKTLDRAPPLGLEEERAAPEINHGAKLVIEPYDRPLDQVTAHERTSSDILVGPRTEKKEGRSAFMVDDGEMTSLSEVVKPHQMGGELNSFYPIEYHLETRPSALGQGGRAGQDEGSREIECMDGISSPHCMQERTRGDDSKKKKRGMYGRKMKFNYNKK